MVEGRRQHRRGGGDEVHLPLPVVGISRGRGLRGAQRFAVLVGRLPIGDVEERALDAQRPAASVGHDRCLVPHPDRSAVAGDEPVLERAGRRALASGREPLDHAVAVVGMDEPREEPGVGEPLLGRVPEQAVDLRADERRRPVRVRGADVRDDGQVRRERAVLRFDLAEAFADPADLARVVRDEQGLAAVAHGDGRDGDHELRAVAAPVHGLLRGERLALLDRGEKALGLVLVDEQVGKRTADDLVLRVAVHRGRARAPAGDRALGIERHDGLGSDVAHGRERASGAVPLPRGRPRAVGEPADETGRGEPCGQRDQRLERLVGDEEEVQPPADGRGDEPHREAAQNGREHRDRDAGGGRNDRLALRPLTDGKMERDLQRHRDDCDEGGAGARLCD